MSSDTLSGFAALVRSSISQRQEEIVDYCSRLVAARSVNPPGDTRLVAAIVSDELADNGIPCRLLSKADTMPNVLAEIDSGRPGLHLVLNVHLDTMPAGDEANWSVEPYELTRRDGRLYGLGMGNMKGSVAAMTYALAVLNAHRDQWSGRITFTAVSDEVVFGPHGAAHLLESEPSLYGDALICGEGPGFRRLSIAEKGVLWLSIETDGEPGHSSSVKPMASASAKLAQLISEIDRLNGTRTAAPAELADLFSPSDDGFELTANVGVIQAGNFVGQVATRGRAEIDFRVPPGMTIDEVERQVRSLCEQIPGTEVSRIKGWDPNWTSEASDICQAWRAAEEALGEESAQCAIRLPASDASRWRAHGTPALCFGPQPSLSAGVNDYAEETEVIRCAELFALGAYKFLSQQFGASESQDEKLAG